MYATTGIIQGNTVLIDDSLIKHYNGKKVIVTVLEDDKHYDTITDEKLFAISDSLIDKNIEAYKELAKWFFFEFEQVTRIHSSLIAKTGGLDGIRDKNLLDSALKVPFQTFDGKDLYPDILDKATQLCFSLINNHPFSDGNKRIGIHLTLLFLKINNVQLNYVQQELIDLGFGIASSKLQKNDIRKWFENHVVGQY